MSAEQTPPKGPDFSTGIAPGDVPDGGMIAGHVGGDAVLLARRGAEWFAIDATCTHYHGPLGDGLVVGDTVRCPWHHACFSLRTGEALGAPAFTPVACWKVEQRDGKVFVHEKAETTATPKAKARGSADKPGRIVIVGGGGASFAAAEMLRREGFDGSLTMVSADETAPYDRPNCSKDLLAGTAPEEWMPLQSPEFYKDQSIDLVLATEVAAIDPKARQVALAGGRSLPFDRLLLATGAEPVRLDLPGAKSAHVHVLRSLADCRAIIADAASAKRAVVIGGSFIGLEVAAALRARKIEVHVVAPDKRPLERVLGPELGDVVRRIHEENGVVFHLEERATAIADGKVTLKSGKVLAADLVVVGIGVRPRLQLAERAGLKLDRGVVVDRYLETSASGIYAAGDIARWPDKVTGDSIRAEHWVVAQRHGQAAARNMLGQERAFTDVPFFWSQHYDMPVNYVGHAEKWDETAIEGDGAGKDCVVRYKRGGRVLAAASIYRDVANLQIEAAMEVGAL